LSAVTGKGPVLVLADEAQAQERAIPLRVLVYDIELQFKVAPVFDLKNVYINPSTLLTDQHMISWSAKWSDSDTIKSQVLTVAEAKARDDRRIVEGLAGLVRQADYTVAHNNNGFDHKVLNGYVMQHGLEPLGHTQTIDTLTIARSSFRLTSNRLGYLANLLGIPGKLDTDFSLWTRCYFAEGSALKEMHQYNRRDVTVVEEVFHRIKPHAKTLPRLFEGTEFREEFCPYCGEKPSGVKGRKKDGYHRTKASTYQRFRCLACGRRYRAWNALGEKRPGSIGL
jgi:DNA polymerase III epsilon subunit-like protein